MRSRWLGARDLAILFSAAAARARETPAASITTATGVRLLEASRVRVKGKSADTFGPIGPWLVTTDEIPDPQNLKMWLEVDGRRYQNGSTRTMIFGVRQLVSYLSRFMSLQPGDIISTGTPPGVGWGNGRRFI